MRSITLLLLFDNYFIYSTFNLLLLFAARRLKREEERFRKEGVKICDCKGDVDFSPLLPSFQRRKF